MNPECWIRSPCRVGRIQPVVWQTLSKCFSPSLPLCEMDHRRDACGGCRAGGWEASPSLLTWPGFRFLAGSLGIQGWHVACLPAWWRGTVNSRSQTSPLHLPSREACTATGSCHLWKEIELVGVKFVPSSRGVGCVHPPHG